MASSITINGQMLNDEKVLEINKTIEISNVSDFNTIPNNITKVIWLDQEKGGVFIRSDNPKSDDGDTWYSGFKRQQYLSKDTKKEINTDIKSDPEIVKSISANSKTAQVSNILATVSDDLDDLDVDQNTAYVLKPDKNVKPILTYDWSIETINNKRYIVNQNDKKYNGKIFSGKGIKITGGEVLNLTIGGQVNTIAYMLDGKVYYNETLQTLDTYNISSIGIHQNYIFYNGLFTSEEKYLLESDPEAFLYKVGDILKSDVLEQSKLDNIVAYFPLIEDGDTVYNNIKKEIITTHTTSYSTTLNDDETSTWSNITNNTYSIDVTTAGTNGNRPAIAFDLDTPVKAGEIMRVITNVTNVTGGTNGVLKNANVSYGNGRFKYDLSISNGGVVDIPVDADVTSARFEMNGTEVFSKDVTFEIQSVVLDYHFDTINNYKETTRINELPYGPQSFMYNINNTIIDKYDKPRFNNVSYIDTNFIFDLDTDLTINTVLNKANSNISGIGSSEFYIARNTSGDVLIKFGLNIELSVPNTNDKCLITFKYIKLSKKVELYVDEVKIYELPVIIKPYFNETFTLGKINNMVDSYINNSEHFIYVNKGITNQKQDITASENFTKYGDPGVVVKKDYKTINEMIQDLENKRITSSEQFKNMIPNIDYNPGITYYVDGVNGDDNGSGDLDTPYKTITKVISVIDIYKQNNNLPYGGILVYIREGNYRFSTVLTLDTNISGESNKPIIFKAYNNETVDFSGSEKLINSNFTKIVNSDSLYNIFDSSVVDNIYTYDLSNFELGDMRSLTAEIIVNKKPYEIARYPKKGTNSNIQTIDDAVITISGNTVPNVSGTYTKQDSDTWVKDTLVNGIQFEIKRNHIPNVTYNNNWTINDATNHKTYWDVSILENGLVKSFFVQHNGATGVPTTLSPNTITDGFLWWDIGVTNTTFKYRDNKLETYSTSEMYVNAMYSTGWWNQITKITNVDTTNKVVTIDKVPIYGITTNGQQPYYYLNVPEELTEIGEYYIDRVNKKLYILTDNINQDIEITVNADHVVKIKGDNIVLDGINIINSRKNLFEITGSNNVIRNSYIGNNRLDVFDIYGSNNIIEYCEITNNGARTGTIYGGDRATLVNGNNKISNCYIHDSNRYEWTYKGINLKNCGNICENNYFHNIKHIATSFGGNEHIIRNNYYDNAMNFGSDSAVIYTGRDWGYRGNKVEYNYFTNIKNNLNKSFAGAVYFDDSSSGMYIRNNIFNNIDGRSIFINGGRDNTIINNVYNDVTVCIDTTDVGKYNINNIPGSSSNFLEKITSNGINYKQEPWKSKYPRLYKIPNDWSLVDGTHWVYPEGIIYLNNINNNGNVTITDNTRNILKKWGARVEIKSAPQGTQNIDINKISIQ